MEYFLFLFSLSAVMTAISGRAHCHACFDEICYSRAVIFQQFPISGQLAVDRNENIVYFHYESNQHNKSEYHTLGFDMDDIKFTYIPNIQFSFARTVDQTTSDVYIGGTNGIFKYNPKNNNTINFGLSDKTIWHMQWKNKIFYTIFLTEGLYTLEKSQSKKVAELNNFVIDDFIIDKKDDIYFMSNLTGYVLKKGEKKPSVFSDVIYGLSTDINDSAYFVKRENRGLYKIDYRSGRLRLVGAFGEGSPYKILFDKYNNVIYYDSDSHKLYYLTPNYAKCKVAMEGKGHDVKTKKKIQSFVVRIG